MSKANPGPKRKKTAKPKYNICNLKKIREAQGLTIVELHDLSGVNRGTISNIEWGMIPGQVEQHNRLIKALKTSPDEYYGHDSAKVILENETEIILSNKGFTVEEISTHYGKLKRVQIAHGESSSLKGHLDPQKPATFYFLQGEITVHQAKQTSERKPHDVIAFPLANNISIQNTSNLPGMLLIHQP